MSINYWANKEARAAAARLHTGNMAEDYSRQINTSVQYTKIYDNNSFNSDIEEDIPDVNTSIVIEDMDSVSAIMKYGGMNAAVLNFSSYKNPGGMFMEGSKAQEECLCHESFLYNVLIKFRDKFYDWNIQHKNKALYLNRGLYTPDIWFVRDENNPVECNVITCAAPNKKAAQKYCRVSNEENTEVLKSRIKFVLDIAKTNNINTLILGAYGCGVFGQNAEEVAAIFKEYLSTTYKCFSTVVFAIPAGDNYDTFVKIFS